MSAERYIGALAAIRDWFSNECVGSIPFIGVRMWIHQRMGVRFADRRRTTLMMHVELIQPRSITIGARSVVGRECILDGRGQLTIGSDVNIGGRTQIFTGTHDVNSEDFVAEFLPVRIEDHAWIAIGSIVLPGVTIGRGAVVAAGSVVTRDLEPMGIYAGSPARRIGTRESDLNYRIDYRPNGF